MKKIAIVALLFSLFLPILRGSSMPEIQEYNGSLAGLLESAREIYGPFEGELVLEDGALLRGENFSLEILRDNYRGSDYLIFINN